MILGHSCYTIERFDLVIGRIGPPRLPPQAKPYMVGDRLCSGRHIGPSRSDIVDEYTSLFWLHWWGFTPHPIAMSQSCVVAMDQRRVLFSDPDWIAANEVPEYMRVAASVAARLDELLRP